MKPLVSILLALGLAGSAAAQDPDYAHKRIPFEPGFRVYIVADMEGQGSVVHTGEVIAGNEAPRYRELTSRDYWEHYRRLLTEEVNATIAGARAGGAQSFVVCSRRR